MKRVSSSKESRHLSVVPASGSSETPLTRAQVAARLDVSISTVRRFEGTRLHPKVDDDEVHWFDPKEVAALAVELTNEPRTARRRNAAATVAPARSRDAQHLAAELMGRFLADRAPMASVALTVDSSALTAIGNDYGFGQVFARQVRGLGRTGDVLVGISTSGNSANVVAAFEAARETGVRTIALTGGGGGKMGELADLLINAPSLSTPRIQELHIAIGHTICELVEDALL